MFLVQSNTLFNIIYKFIIWAAGGFLNFLHLLLWLKVDLPYILWNGSEQGLLNDPQSHMNFAAWTGIKFAAKISKMSGKVNNDLA
jgi:hypothetical protein